MIFYGLYQIVQYEGSIAVIDLTAVTHFEFANMAQSIPCIFVKSGASIILERTAV